KHGRRRLQRRLLFLAGPAGWLVWLAAFLGELVASAVLGLVFPVAALIGALRALPAVVASSLRRAALGLLAAACTFAALVAALFLSALLGFLLVRHWVEEPAQPSAAVSLGGALPPGHSVRVSMALLLPDSYHNHDVGMFQIKAEALSVTGLTIASAAQPYMLRYRSAPVRLAQSALMCVPLTLGLRGETQAANLKVLQYREGHGRHQRTGLVRVLLQPRAATVQLPQVYKAEIVVQTTLPFAKGLERGLKWTLRLSELRDSGKMASDLGTGDIGGSPSNKELDGDFAAKRRERRSKRKAQFRSQLHGGSMEHKFAEGSTSSVPVVETGVSTNPIQGVAVKFVFSATDNLLYMRVSDPDRFYMRPRG
ncbi:hypothetical protein BS78_K151800, partial [Paspalum vaginatum]